MPIPWLKLVKHAPTFISLSRELLQRSGREPAAAVPEEQLLLLASDLQRQAEVLHALAGELDALTAAIAAQRRSLLFACALGAGAFLLAAAALVLAVLR